jgi:hypothetical protein
VLVGDSPPGEEGIAGLGEYGEVGSAVECLQVLDVRVRQRELAFALLKGGTGRWKTTRWRRWP